MLNVPLHCDDEVRRRRGGQGGTGTLLYKIPSGSQGGLSDASQVRCTWGERCGQVLMKGNNDRKGGRKGKKRGGGGNTPYIPLEDGQTPTAALPRDWPISAERCQPHPSRSGPITLVSYSDAFAHFFRDISLGFSMKQEKIHDWNDADRTSELYIEKLPALRSEGTRLWASLQRVYCTFVSCIYF